MNWKIVSTYEPNTMLTFVFFAQEVVAMSYLPAALWLLAAEGETGYRAQGESSGRKWGTGYRVRKEEGSLGCLVHPCRYWTGGPVGNQPTNHSREE
eukprot:1187633-Prorocentrum_minimum.AAC.2